MTQKRDFQTASMSYLKQWPVDYMPVTPPILLSDQDPDTDRQVCVAPIPIFSLVKISQYHGIAIIVIDISALVTNSAAYHEALAYLDALGNTLDRCALKH